MSSGGPSSISTSYRRLRDGSPGTRCPDETMSMKLYAHPFSSYCQKVLIALYENDIPFAYRALTPEQPEAFAELEALWPFKLFPVLTDGERTVAEATIIIEYLHVHHPGAVRLIPDDPPAAIEARFMDR